MLMVTFACLSMATGGDEQLLDDQINARIEADFSIGGNLLANGDFETLNKAGTWPAGWGNGPSAEITAQVEDGQRFLRLTQQTPEKLLLLYRVIPLRSQTAGLEIFMRYRTTNIKKGKKSLGDARVIFHFLDGARTGRLEVGNNLKPEPPTIGFASNASHWTEVTQRCVVPAGATKLQMMAGLWFAGAGVIDFDVLRITPMSTDAVQAMLDKEQTEREAASRQQRDREIALAQIMALPPTSGELKVVGNQVLNANGTAVWLQGVCVDSMQWSAGENILWSTRVALDEWKANIIRLPIDEKFWFGHGNGQEPGDETNYRTLVDAVVRLVAARGAHVILDLHSFGAPTQVHVAFWQDAAKRYGNNPAVLFELFNEPHGISWKVWRDGGDFNSGDHIVADEGAAENDIKVIGNTSTGMQALVDVVRATGAQNIVIVGGVDWSYDLTGVVDGFALDDRGGNGMIYVSHVYPWKSGWEKKFLVAAKRFPIIITEVGCQPTPMPWQKTTEDPATWAPDMLGLIQKHRLHWTGFSFHPQTGPRVILDWNYTPSPYWGAYVKEALGGKVFELKTMR